MLILHFREKIEDATQKDFKFPNARGTLVTVWCRPYPEPDNMDNFEDDDWIEFIKSKTDYRGQFMVLRRRIGVRKFDSPALFKGEVRDDFW